MDGIQKTIDAIIEIRGVNGVVAFSSDGFMLSSFELQELDPEGIAAVCAHLFAESGTVGDEMGFHSLRWAVMEHTLGNLLLARKGDVTWAIVTDKHAVIGELLAALDAAEDGE